MGVDVRADVERSRLSGVVVWVVGTVGVVVVGMVGVVVVEVNQTPSPAQILTAFVGSWVCALWVLDSCYYLLYRRFLD